MSSKSSRLYPNECCLFLSSSPKKIGFSFLITSFLSKSTIWLLKCLYSLARKSLILLLVKTFPFSILTPIISPGPNLPLVTILFSSNSIMPVSDPAQRILSLVIVYLIGRRPFLSVAAIAHSLSVAAIAAGPSHGSIVLLRKLNNC